MVHTTQRCYGEFVRLDVVPDSADAAEARFTHWVRLNGVPNGVDELQYRGGYFYDYGLMASFVDTKLAEIADKFAAEAAAEKMRAQKVRRSLEGRYAVSSDGFTTSDARADRPAGPALAGAHVLPKLLCGLYGGYFLAERIPQEMGVGPFLSLECTIDGAHRQTYDFDNF